MAVFVVLDGGRSWALFGPAVSVSARELPSEWTQVSVPPRRVRVGRPDSVTVVSRADREVESVSGGVEAERRSMVVVDVDGRWHHPEIEGARYPSRVASSTHHAAAAARRVSVRCVSSTATATNHPPPPVRNPGGEAIPCNTR